ncbi:hypothetical protein BDC45DRAFT_567054 [Circinella umbellata]|nr:hypothetical protein BDC45DRAFT_567054 [Circinella umbellata]
MTFITFITSSRAAVVQLNNGSVLIFGAYLAHRSGNNNTNNSRIAVYLTYNAAREGDMRNHY